MKMRIGMRLAAVITVMNVLAATDLSAQFQPAGSLGALAPANLAKPRPKPPFDLTGTWLHGGGADNGFRFSPPAGFKLTPEAQKHYDAAQKAQAEGKVYHDDIGQCWPAGLPVIMTRVWPIAMIQLPTAIYMVSEFMNSFRVVYLDGRPHTNPDIVVPSFNGESIGRWEGDTLVIDTKYFVPDHHWVDSGIPGSEDLHIVERMKLTNQGQTLEIEYTLTDPKSWVGDWKMTKRWRRVDDRDIAEVSCLPDLNQHMPTTQSKDNVR
ncbi:MAG TPA: hypothetical protein VMB70_02600 [Terriglobia bacterium]|nr:hypothetical protein [Terriglobia bacterium]